MRETSRVFYDRKFCFKCRRKTTHHKVVYVEAEPGYYGPTVRLECEGCRQDHRRMDGEPVRFGDDG